MPDIFGKSQKDYGHLVAIQKGGFMDAHNKELAVRGKTHSFNALCDSHNPVAQPLNDVEAVAQAVGFVTNNLQAIQAQVEETLYLDFRLNELIPIVTNVPEGATTYSYRVTDKAGQGSFIENNGTNASGAGISARNVPYSIEYAGIVAKWSIEDLRRAAFTGIPLDSETIDAAATGAMDHIEKVGLVGDAARNFVGLTNLSGIPTSTAAANWSTLSAEALVKVIQAEITAVIKSTNEIVGRVIKKGLTIYLPIDQFALVTETNIAADANKTVWDFVSQYNTWTQMTGQKPMIKQVAELATAGAGSTARLLVGFNDVKVMEMAIPMMPRVITTINHGYTVDAPLEYKVSGLNVKRPGTMRYVDDI